MTHPYASRTPVYIAAPYTDANPDRIELNVRRAAMLARLALVEGLHPVVTHPTGLLTGMSDVGLQRDVLLGWGIGMVRIVAKHTAGKFWLLLHDDQRITDGCRQELAEWERQTAGRTHRMGTWREFEQAFHVAGLRSQWEALRAREAEGTGVRP